MLFWIFFFLLPAQAIHPSQIECFGVLGDSISAGFSMESHSIIKDFYEYRGQAFAIGGLSNFLTIPNIFQKYNSQLQLNNSCASFAKTFITHSLDQYQQNNSFALHNRVFFSQLENLGEVNCNVAISGALSNQLEQMWINLQQEWQKFQCTNRWKLLTIMIGANDICEYCINGYNNTITTYMFNMEQLFKNIINQSEKIFINVVSTFDVSLTQDWQRVSCETIHYLINECPCILGRNRQKNAKEKVGELYKAINQKLAQLVKKYANVKKDIEIGLQPILEDFRIYNESYLSSLDCFHPSEFGNKVMATILWNNMFLPPEEKMTNMEFMQPLYVPNENDNLQ
jgi:phospholipase B1